MNSTDYRIKEELEKNALDALQDLTKKKTWAGTLKSWFQNGSSTAPFSNGRVVGDNILLPGSERTVVDPNWNQHITPIPGFKPGDMITIQPQMTFSTPIARTSENYEIVEEEWYIAREKTEPKEVMILHRCNPYIGIADAPSIRILNEEHHGPGAFMCGACDKAVPDNVKAIASASQL